MTTKKHSGTPTRGFTLTSKKLSSMSLDDATPTESAQSYIIKKLTDAMESILDFKIYGFSIFRKRKTLHLKLSKDFDSFRRIVLQTPDGKSHPFILTK